MILESSNNTPIIVVDIQPAYEEANPALFRQAVKFVCERKGKVLMFVNAEKDMYTSDTLSEILYWWQEKAEEFDLEIDWDRFELFDKGYGYLRNWMDDGVAEDAIIATIRELYRQRLSDSQDLNLKDLEKRSKSDSKCKLIIDAIDRMKGEPLTVEWVNLAQLKRFSGAYLLGGARTECLKEIELMMNAFNIRYKRVNKLIYPY